MADLPTQDTDGYGDLEPALILYVWRQNVVSDGALNIPRCHEKLVSVFDASVPHPLILGPLDPSEDGQGSSSFGLSIICK